MECKCGCGKEANYGEWIKGHWNKKKKAWNKGMKGFCNIYNAGFKKGKENPQVKKTEAYSKYTEEQVKPLFDKWVFEHIGLKIYAVNIHKSAKWLKIWFKKYFPHEYEVHKEKLQSKNSKYKRGRAFEYSTMDRYKEKGYFVMRSAGSHTPIDILAVKKGKLLFIQCKIGGTMQRKEREDLIELANSVDAIPLLIRRIGRGKIVEKDAREIKSKKSISAT